MSTYSHQSLIKLAQSILENSKIIEEFFSSNNLLPLSFNVNGPKTFPVGIEHTEIHNAHYAVIDATKELRDLVIGPKDTLNWMLVNVSIKSTHQPLQVRQKEMYLLERNAKCQSSLKCP
jgi:hypothetical protein